MPYPGNTQGTTLDGVLAALTDLTNLLRAVHDAQETDGAAAMANAMQPLGAKLDALKVCMDRAPAETPVTSARLDTIAAEAVKLVAELVKQTGEMTKQTALLTEIRAQLAKGLLVKTVLSL